MKPYEEFEHSTAWAFRAFGKDLKELFENAAIALFALEGALDAQSTVEHKLRVSGSGREKLLVNWLSELLELQEKENESFQQFSITDFRDSELSATIKGAPASQDKRLVKGILADEIRIKATDEGWEATLFVEV